MLPRPFSPFKTLWQCCGNADINAGQRLRRDIRSCTRLCKAVSGAVRSAFALAGTSSRVEAISTSLKLPLVNSVFPTRDFIAYLLKCYSASRSEIVVATVTRNICRHCNRFTLTSHLFSHSIFRTDRAFAKSNRNLRCIKWVRNYASAYKKITRLDARIYFFIIRCGILSPVTDTGDIEINRSLCRALKVHTSRSWVDTTDLNPLRIRYHWARLT